jgi:hypothetical protein
MERFAELELKLKKNVKKRDKESLLSLFSPADRFKQTEVFIDADEGSNVNVILEGLGKIDLKLGADMEKGQKKTIMTLFWFVERSKLIEMMRDAAAGEMIPIKMLVAT